MSASAVRRRKAVRGRAQEGPVALWLELFRKHELLTYASSIARTMIVAGVALSLLGLGVLGAIGRQDLWFRHLAPQIHGRVLPGVYAGIDGTVRHIFAANSPELIAFAVLLAVWEVSGSVRGISGALNRIYETPETRSWKLRFPVSFAISAAVVTALVSAILLILAAGGLVSGVLGFPFAIVRWLGAILLMAIAFGLVVRFAPAAPRAKRWATVGASMVVAGWVVESIVFDWYVTSVASFRTAIGSLTVILVVISYLYIGSIILLVGIELDELLREEGDVERNLTRHFSELARAARKSMAVTRAG